MTEEYKHLASETIYLGDTVKIQETLLGIDLKVRVISRKYDVMKQKPLSMTLSNIPIEEKRTTVSDSTIIKQLKDQIKQSNNSVAEYVQSMINSGSTNSYVLCRQNEILAMDNKDINSAINVVRLNKHGLAFSQTGYYGEYTYGFTIDGVLNASLIRTGILTAILIQSVSGDCSINLETGEVNFNKGIIKGLNSEWNLNTGKFTTSATIDGVIYSLVLSNGGLTSNDFLRLVGAKGITLKSNTDWLRLEANTGDKQSVVNVGDVAIYLNANSGSGSIDMYGNVFINGTSVNTTLSAMETYMLRSEGII